MLDFTKVRIGQRVSYKKYFETIPFQGRIINIMLGEENRILVEFDKPFHGGHKGNGIGTVQGKKDQCYWLFEWTDDFVIVDNIKEMLEAFY